MKLAQILSKIKTDFKISCDSQLLDSIDVNDIALDSRRIKKENVTIF